MSSLVHYIYFSTDRAAPTAYRWTTPVNRQRCSELRNLSTKERNRIRPDRRPTKHIFGDSKQFRRFVFVFALRSQAISIYVGWKLAKVKMTSDWKSIWRQIESTTKEANTMSKFSTTTTTEGTTSPLSSIVEGRRFDIQQVALKSFPGHIEPQHHEK